ncbi:MAG: MFS transporter [Legionellaceae bacterium]|nr:MFS transporter [Legionellaceae bacterium]
MVSEITIKKFDRKYDTDKLQLWVILFIVFIRFVGTSIPYPIFPPLFLHPTDSSIIPADWLESTRRILLGFTLAAYPLGQFIGSPILGRFSDYYGRKKILVFSLVGGAIGYLITAITLQYSCLWLLLASRFLVGAMEGNLAITRAMVSEIKSVNQYKGIGKLQSACAVGYIIGPVIGGIFSDKHIFDWFSYPLPFLLAALLCIFAFTLAILSIPSKRIQPLCRKFSIWEELNLIKQFQQLFSKNMSIKYLIITCTVFAFSIDVFYDFGPVYLAGKWSMSPAEIASYTSVLSLALALGSIWLPHYLSRYFSIQRVTLFSMLITSIALGLMVIFQSPIFMFLLFGILGLSITTAIINMTISILNASEPSARGEVMGAELSLRMFGNGLICLVGGFLLVLSVVLPIALSCIIALLATAFYAIYLKKI